MRLPIQRYWHLLARYLTPQLPQLLALALALFLGIGLRLAVPQVARLFLDTVVSGGGSLTTLLLLAGAFCVAGFADVAMNVVVMYLGTNVAWTATNTMRADLLAHCFTLDMSFHHAHTPGKMIERIDGDVEELSNFFSQFAVQLLGNVLLIVGVLIVLLVEDWRIGVVFALFTLVALLVFNRVRDTAAPSWNAAREASGAMYGFLEERLGGINDIRANGANNYVRRGFALVAGTLFRSNRKAIAMSVVVGNGAELILVLGGIGALAVAAMLYRAGAVQIGTVYLVTAYAALINRPLQEIISQIDDLQRATASITRVEQLSQLQPSIRDGRGRPLGRGACAVAFANVSFSYDTFAGWQAASTAREDSATDEQEPHAPAVIRDVSFRLMPGEVLGLIGHTGSGKTTIIRLLLRLYDPTFGNITLDGVDLRDLHLDQLRGRVGIVTQDVHLFHATLRDNLTVFDTSISDEQIVAVLGELGLSDWLAALPHSLDTLLAAGSGLSAGEAQLLAVVRVFLRDPSLVILDEASSRLDPVTERMLERTFDRLLRGRTAIIIAHRLRTVQRVDTIMVLDQGQVKEYGSRAQLSTDLASTFARLRQLGLEDTM